MPEDQNLIELEQNLVQVIQETTDFEQKKALQKQLATIQALKDQLIDRNLDAARQEYEEATLALQEANQSLTETLNDATKISQTFAKVAKVVDALSKVAEKVT